MRIHFYVPAREFTGVNAGPSKQFQKRGHLIYVYISILSDSTGEISFHTQPEYVFMRYIFK